MLSRRALSLVVRHAQPHFRHGRAATGQFSATGAITPNVRFRGDASSDVLRPLPTLI